MENFKKTSSILMLFSFFLAGCSYNQEQKEAENLVEISDQDTPEQIIKKAAHVVPSTRQLEWQKLEYTAFVHFGLYTFNANEGHDSGHKEVLLTPDAFNPVELDCRQWAKAFKEAGMKGVILTAKHHEGFCLWPTRYSDYSVKNSKWRNGKGDVVKELSEACKEYGLKLGIYLSPWDKHNPDYGTPLYDAYFKNQLTELLSNYGEIFEVWFDGFYGGLKEEKQPYDWKGYVDLVRELQPNATIAIMGPDIRWVGTESGYGRDTEWSVIPATDKDLVKVPSGFPKEKTLEQAFIPSRDMVGKDLGSREKLLKAKALAWYPAEVDVSIRPSWGYRSEEDELVKTPEKLMDIYYNSVGMNALLLLNVAPNPKGLIHENDIKALMAFKKLRDETFKTNLLDGSVIIKAMDSRKDLNPLNMLVGDKYWSTKEGITTAVVEFDMKMDKTFDQFLIQENIQNGQRIEAFSIEAWRDGNWEEISSGTTIGYKRILRFPEITSSKVRLKIRGSRDCPEIKYVGLFNSPTGEHSIME